MNSALNRYIFNNLNALNRQYYEEHIAPKQSVKIGNEAKCSNCGEMKPVRYLYGGKSPLCILCAKDILN